MSRAKSGWASVDDVVEAIASVFDGSDSGYLIMQFDPEPGSTDRVRSDDFPTTTPLIVEFDWEAQSRGDSPYQHAEAISSALSHMPNVSLGEAVKWKVDETAEPPRYRLSITILHELATHATQGSIPNTVDSQTLQRVFGTTELGTKHAKVLVAAYEKSTISLEAALGVIRHEVLVTTPIDDQDKVYGAYLLLESQLLGEGSHGISLDAWAKRAKPFLEEYQYLAPWIQALALIGFETLRITLGLKGMP